MPRSLFRAMIFALLASGLSFAFPPGVFAGEPVVINGGANSVVGNSPLPNGEWPADDSQLTSPAEKYQVTVNAGGQVTGDAVGAKASSISGGDVLAAGNAVTINGSATGAVDGGQAVTENGGGTGTASNNSVAVGAGGSVGNSVRGGNAASEAGGAVTANNTATIDGDVGAFDIDGNVNIGSGGVSGGSARSAVGDAAATGNAVTIGSGGRVGNAVYGGEAVSNTGDAAASGNKVFINGRTFDALDGDVVAVGVGGVNGGRAWSIVGDVAATGNTATVGAGGIVKNSLYGGWAFSDYGDAAASNNTVIIDGNVSDEFDAGVVDIGDRGVNGGGAYSRTGDVAASNNTVIIRGNGAVEGDVHGGHAGDAWDAYHGEGDRVSGDSTSSGNTVIIEGNSRVSGAVYGGYADSYSDLYPGLYSGLAAATGNAIVLSGAPVVTGSLSGGGGAGRTGSDFFTGNTLNVYDYKGSASAASVQNFEYYNFTFPAAQTGPVLAVTGAATLGNGQRGSTITANTLSGTNPAQVGESATLITAGGGIIQNGPAQELAGGKHGATLLYDWRVATATGNDLTVTLENVNVDPKAEALSRGFLSGLSGVDQGADLAAGPGMGNAVSASLGDQDAGAFRLGQSMGYDEDVDTGEGENESGARASRFGIFAAVSGGKSGDSRVDMSGMSLMAGAAWGKDSTPGHLTLGAFFEYGKGTYDVDMSFPDGTSVYGDGDIRRTGGGLLGRLDFSHAGPGHAYAEASFRLGVARNAYRSDGLRDVNGRNAAYDSSSLYYGSHFGIGYVWDVGQAASLDLFGKFFWTRHQGDSLTLSTGDPVEFKHVDSRRLRVGGRFTYAATETIGLYAGAAYEHAFDNKVRAVFPGGHALDAPGLGGGSGVGELGVLRNPAGGRGFYTDMGIQGYIGKREGMAGNLRFGWVY